MNDDLQTALADILIKATETAESAGEFVLAELPDVAQQLLAWHYVHSMIGFVIGWIVALLFIFMGWWFPRWLELDQGDKIGTWIAFIFFGALISEAILFSNLDWLKIIIAPKLYILEYAADLVR